MDQRKPWAREGSMQVINASAEAGGCKRVPCGRGEGGGNGDGSAMVRYAAGQRPLFT
jgi:hypothetical protein